MPHEVFDTYERAEGPRPLKFDGGFDIRKGSGVNFPGVFVPPSPNITPERLFRNLRAFMRIRRYTLPRDTGVGLIYTDGACLDNGQDNPRAGWSFWHGLGPSNQRLVYSTRLEKRGPFGDAGAQTSNRAELRAVIGALRLRVWNGEGFHTMVIATDSEYVVKGATEWARSWVQNGWRTSSGAPVQNRDLWEALLGEVDRYKLNEMEIKFWRIPREWNTVADQGAKEGAAQDDVLELWRDINGINGINV